MLFKKLREQSRQACTLRFVTNRNDRLFSKRAEARKRFSGAFGKRKGGVLSEGQHPTVRDLRLEAECVGDRGWDKDSGWRGEFQPRRFKIHLAATALDQKNLR